MEKGSELEVKHFPNESSVLNIAYKHMMLATTIATTMITTRMIAVVAWAELDSVAKIVS